ncbi:unnamed protein product [Penicillium egyptiacum]|uniref:Transmembrane protein n=1 Tax=Penicillium egyptiacum TaxID=1303716 RepID=A0A9W4KQ91_9EURO|nr:unnamed protein product [Penicillium egyptiacum]
MLFRPLFTTFFVLLLSFSARGASIGARSGQISGPDKATTQTIIQPQPVYDAASANALAPRVEQDHDTIPRLHETTIDWREDGSESLRLESLREAGFLPSSYHESDDPLPQFWPLFKVCIVSAIAICILKIIRDLKR